MADETRAVAALLLAAALAAAPAWAQRSTTAKEMPADQLKKKLDAGEKVLVIDLRSAEEVKTGSIPGAIHIPEDQLQARMKEIPRDVQVVFT